jgi:hypothetical protein
MTQKCFLSFAPALKCYARSPMRNGMIKGNMNLPNDPTVDQIVDHLRVTGKLLALIEQLSRKENSCDHTLVHNYAIQAASHLQAANSLLTRPEHSGN